MTMWFKIRLAGTVCLGVLFLFYYTVPTTLNTSSRSPRVAVSLQGQMMYNRQPGDKLSTENKENGIECGSSTFTDEVLLKLIRTTERIAKSSEMWNRGKRNILLDEVYNELWELVANHSHQSQLERLDNSTHAVKKRDPDVCDEIFIGVGVSRTDPMRPYNRRGHFEMTNCTDVPEFHTLITLMFNFVKYDSKYYKYIPDMFHYVNRLYPGVRVVAAVPDNLALEEQNFKHTTLTQIKKSETEPDIWNKLISRVTTKYVYIGRNVIKIMWHVRLERLVREINNLEASVVSGAYRTLTSGEWTNGCFQSGLSNYMLMYKHGYHRSKEECLFCHHVNGPFVAKTEFMKQQTLPVNMSATSSFAMWFLKLKGLEKTVVSCPDSMSFVTDESQVNISKEDWLGLTRALEVEHVHSFNKKVFNFNCAEANKSCKGFLRPKGLFVPRCCSNILADTIHAVMKVCKEAKLTCEVESGTLLGAVKFNNVLPWEAVDADLHLDYHNITAFGKLKFLIQKQGYEWRPSGRGLYSIHASSWFVEVKQDVLRTPQADGITPTLIEFNGRLLQSSTNPGLEARNSYGHEMYQHAEHWRHRDAKKKSENSAKFYSEAAKTFSECPKPGHHSCLNQFIPDGNLMLEEPTV